MRRYHERAKYTQRGTDGIGGEVKKFPPAAASPNPPGLTGGHSPGGPRLVVGGPGPARTSAGPVPVRPGPPGGPEQKRPRRLLAQRRLIRPAHVLPGSAAGLPGGSAGRRPAGGGPRPPGRCGKCPEVGNCASGAAGARKPGKAGEPKASSQGAQRSPAKEQKQLKRNDGSVVVVVALGRGVGGVVDTMRGRLGCWHGVG